MDNKNLFDCSYNFTNICTNFKGKKYIYFYVIIIYSIYELVAQTKIFNINIFMSDIIAYIIPIVLIITVTFWIMNSKTKKIAIFSLINFLIFLTCLFIIYKKTGKFENTNYMKYPFRIYYLSYAFFVSSLLIIIFRNQKITNLLYNNMIQFISKSSLWIYLWHILFIIIFNNVCVSLNWYIKYFCILILSIFVTCIQNEIMDILEKHNINREFINIFRG